VTTYNYTTIDDPSANWTVGLTSGRTEASGINDTGQIVGSYTASDGTGHGFLYSGGIYSNIDYPTATSTVSCTVRESIRPSTIL
jgi:probable HAF family extracellular repeat protein